MLDGYSCTIALAAFESQKAFHEYQLRQLGDLVANVKKALITKTGLELKLK